MGKIKKYLITIVVMLVVSVLALIILGLLTYWFKWQADKAMVGIVVTYVMAGATGGVIFKMLQARGGDRCYIEEKKINRLSTESAAILDSLLLTIIYIATLFVASILFLKTTPIVSSQLFMIFGLVLCSVFVGKLLAK